MSTKFEQLLDYIVNEEMDKANELFHEIVVEKSREIYENLITQEAEEEEQQDESMHSDEEEQQDESMHSDEEEEQQDESMHSDEEEQQDESMGLEDSIEVEGDDDTGDDMGMQDKTDDMLGDIEADGGSEESAMMDIKAAIAELEDAFKELQTAKGMDGDVDAEMPSDFDDEEGEDDDEDAYETMGLREYRETVAKPSGDVAGANTGEKMSAAGATKSPISSGKGKPTTGATAHNILGGKGGQEGGHNTGTSPNKPVKGINPESGEKFTKGVTTNLDGSTTGVKKLSKVAGGHGAEKKGSGPGPVGSGTGDKAGQTSVGQVKSPINGAPGRNA